MAGSGGQNAGRTPDDRRHKVRVGDRVRLRPRNGGDVLDIALAGQIALIESIEQDYESKIHVCVVLDDDPGRDLGLLRQPGHRFFFEADEVEALPPDEARADNRRAKPRVLVAGIGNISSEMTDLASKW